MKASLSKASDTTTHFWEPDRFLPGALRVQHLHHQMQQFFLPLARSLPLTRPISISPSALCPGVSACSAPGGSFPCAIQHELRPVLQKVPPPLCRAFPPPQQARTEHPPCHIPTCGATQLHCPAEQLLLSGSLHGTARHISLAAPATRSSRLRCLLRSGSS